MNRVLFFLLSCAVLNYANAATTFLEPGGDADFGIGTTTGFWGKVNGTAPTLVTDFVHGAHVKSIKFAANVGSNVEPAYGIIANAGGRLSFWIYLVALPSANVRFVAFQTGADGTLVCINLTSAGVLQLWNSTSLQLGSGSTLSTGVWYRLSFVYTVTSTTVNTIKLFKNGVIDISLSNVTLSSIGYSTFTLGNIAPNVNLDFRVSDIYVDNSSALTDPGNVWVTAKRPFANGTTNGFTTQIGSSGSGYGSGHSPQVNERPISNTNGWSILVAGSAITEEYAIETLSQGDIDLTGATIVDYMGWLDCKSSLSETDSIMLAGSTSNISATSTEKVFTKIAGSTTYPAGGTDIGMVTNSTAATASLYECGIIVAYLPAVVQVKPAFLLKMLSP